MAIPQSHPMRFTPKGLTDAFDSTDEFRGACQGLTNLIFDQSNPELVVARTGVEQLAALGSGAGFVSVHTSIDTRVYGLMASTLNPGRDQPFCFDIATGLFIPVLGITAANTPLSPATSGEWEPPTMASVGVFIFVTHPGYAGSANHFGWFDLTNPAVPVWAAGTTTTNALTARPNAVANLYNRAYFAVGNQTQYTDPLTRNRASPNQALVIGDSGMLTALSGLPIQTTSSGVISALVVWKLTQLWQVTGDPTTLNQGLNFLSLSVGTNSPRTIAQSPAGLYFLSTAGPYFIDPLGTLRALTNRIDSSDPDVQAPFINRQTPSRWAGVYNSSVYRLCGPTEVKGEVVTNDYWFDEKKRRWNGPHSFVWDCGSAMATRFVLSSALHPGILISHQATPLLSSVYTDLGANYNVEVDSSTLPKVGDMLQKQVVESQIELGGTLGGATYTIVAQDEGGDELDRVVITIPPSAGLIWGGGGLWGGGGVWAGGTTRPPRTYPIPWTKPLVFEKLQILVTAQAGANLQIGTFYARYQETGYMTPGPTP